MSNRMNLVDLMRAQSVKRWTIVHTTKQQSLAEHTFNVTMIARAICNKAGIPDHNVMKATMAHDLDEILTGDIPTPFKEEARSQGIELNDIMKRVSHVTVSREEAAIAKAADILEAEWFINEFGQGSHADQVKIYMGVQVENYIEGLQVEGLEEELIYCIESVRAELQRIPQL